MFSRPGRPPKRFLPPQFSSTPPLINPTPATPTQSTPTQGKIKPSYDGKFIRLLMISPDRVESLIIVHYIAAVVVLH